MDDIIEHCDEDQFANGQSRRDLRVCWNARELKTQLMEAIDNVGEFVRYVEILSREIATNQRRLL
jgi:hypothetical protein